MWKVPCRQLHSGARSVGSFTPSTTHTGTGLPAWSAFGSVYASTFSRWEDEHKKARRTDNFGPGRQKFELKSITAGESMRKFGLTSSELLRVPHVRRQGITHTDGSSSLFVQFDLQDAALDKFGSKKALDAHLESRQQVRNRRRELKLMAPQSIFTRRRRGNAGKATGSHSVGVALAGNSTVLVAKLGAYGITGSGAMLSEAIHSGLRPLSHYLCVHTRVHASINSG